MTCSRAMSRVVSPAAIRPQRGRQARRQSGRICVDYQSPFFRIRSMLAANNASRVEIAMGCAIGDPLPLCTQLAASGTAEVPSITCRCRLMTSSRQRARALSESRLHSSDPPKAKASPGGSATAPSRGTREGTRGFHGCRGQPRRRGFLTSPDHSGRCYEKRTS